MDKLKPVKASITILIDNTIMEFIPNSDTITRLSKPGMNFIAEHGFAALVETKEKKILIDTGATGVALEHNLSLLGLKSSDIDLTFLSHGHIDHTGGLGKVSGRLITHPDAFHERYLTPNPETKYNLSSPEPDTSELSIEYHTGPVKLADGVMTTGEVPRTHEWEVMRMFKIMREDGLQEDEVLDDQAVVINTEKGLVIVAGCSHAGIINTVEHAIKVSGVENIYCVVGGFHLIGPAEAKIERTINEFKRLGVQKILPIHCTGFEAIKRFSLEMPEEFEYCTAGCKIEA
jgi:7,8-dihydropterin-6-yl-methyl-4-(beta-D-ribofuranosyl)aminobenzene 5'-phosphate synthase